MIQKSLLVALLILLFGLSYGYTDQNSGTKELSLPYTQKVNCTQEKEKYNKDFPSYTRSNCFEKDKKYYYN